MGWSVQITKPITIDGDEGTIYLPEELFEYIDRRNFPVVCVKNQKAITLVKSNDRDGPLRG